MGLSMRAPPVASFSVRDSNGVELIKVSNMDKNLFHRTVPGATGRRQVPQDAARSHRTVPGATELITAAPSFEKHVFCVGETTMVCLNVCFACTKPLLSRWSFFNGGRNGFEG